MPVPRMDRKEGIQMYKTTLTIEGMACGMCEAHVCDAIRQNIPVKKVTASCKRGTAEILSENPPEEETVRRVMEPTGYRLLDMKTEPFEKKRLFGR